MPDPSRGPMDSDRRLFEQLQSASGVDVERIEDLRTVHRIVDDLVSGAKREACSTLPAGPYPIEMLRSSWDKDLQVLRSGVAVPVIYQADAARRPDVLRYLSEFAAAGAQVRVARRVTHRTIIVDRRIAVVAVRQDSLRPPFLVVREPVLVRTMCEQFGATWRSAHSVGVRAEDSLDVVGVAEILQVLSQGLTDDVAARHLGCSARTVRRRVAAVLDLLGASSRFEAGAKAVKAGWL